MSIQFFVVFFFNALAVVMPSLVSGAVEEVTQALRSGTTEELLKSPNTNAQLRRSAPGWELSVIASGSKALAELDEDHFFTPPASPDALGQPAGKDTRASTPAAKGVQSTREQNGIGSSLAEDPSSSSSSFSYSYSSPSSTPDSVHQLSLSPPKKESVAAAAAAAAEEASPTSSQVSATEASRSPSGQLGAEKVEQAQKFDRIREPPPLLRLKLTKEDIMKEYLRLSHNEEPKMVEFLPSHPTEEEERQFIDSIFNYRGWGDAWTKMQQHVLDQTLPTEVLPEWRRKQVGTRYVYFTYRRVVDDCHGFDRCIRHIHHIQVVSVHKMLKTAYTFEALSSRTYPQNDLASMRLHGMLALQSGQTWNTLMERGSEEEAFRIRVLVVQARSSQCPNS